MSSGRMVKVRREKIAACMSCPLCNKLLKEATTISLCLHTFCRKCIYDKFSDEDVESCPVCDINLGCNPIDKLRPDHHLQDIRAKVFPFKRRKVEAPEVTPPVTQPAKRKERSLSSLVVSTPRVSMQAGVTGRRTRAGIRKPAYLRGSSPVAGEPFRKDGYSTEDHSDGSSSPETLNKIVQNRKQSFSSKPGTEDGNMENSNEQWEGKVDLWKPLNCLVEAANRNKLCKPSSQGALHAKSEPLSGPDASICLSRIKVDVNGSAPETDADKNSVPSVPEPAKRKRHRTADRNRASRYAELSSSPQLMHDAALRYMKNVPIWFSLVASEDQLSNCSTILVDNMKHKMMYSYFNFFAPLIWYYFREREATLPQISTGFLRVKDGSMPVSSIQKYLVKKLDLSSEADVQITCQGQPLLPTLQLRSLLDLWLQTSAPASKKVKTSVGDSAKDFVMVLTYSRKVRQPAESNSQNALLCLPSIHP